MPLITPLLRMETVVITGWLKTHPKKSENFNMLNYISWYLFISFLGWLTFPLAWDLFPVLKDRGFSFARIIGILVWGYIFWIMCSLGIVQNDLGGLLLGLVILGGSSLIILIKSGKYLELRIWIKENLRVILIIEALFFLAFTFMAFVRAGNPEINGTEKPMELAFINAILHSPTFPPHDPWLSGYAISYYYFGYVMTAMMAMVTGTQGSIAFNLMLALSFSFCAIGSYGLVFNLLAAWRTDSSTIPGHSSIGSLPLLGPLFLLIVSNFEGFLEILHQRGLFWKFEVNGASTSTFWKWLDIQNLRDAPILPLSWVPERYYWWWRASRVITEYNLAHQWIEIIDEFPFFSYLLGDLHPHVLAMPFGLLAVGVGLNIFLGGWAGRTKLGSYFLPIRPAGVFFAALILGGLAFLNTWDVLIGFSLLVGAFTLSKLFEFGWRWRLINDAFAFGIPIVLIAFLLYLPFFLGFSSQAGGILPNLEFPTRGVQLWIMFGPLFFFIFTWMGFTWWFNKSLLNIKMGFSLAAIIALLIWSFSWILGMIAKFAVPDFVTGYLNNLGFQNAIQLFSAATVRRLNYFGGFSTLLIFLSFSFAFIVAAGNRVQGKDLREEKNEILKIEKKPGNYQIAIFIVFLIMLGGFLVFIPEFIYLRDQFGNRMNTIFKFYYQAWMVWSLAAATGIAILITSLQGIRKWIIRIGLFVILFMALVYPVLGLLDKTNNFRIPEFYQKYTSFLESNTSFAFSSAAQVWTLDGGAFNNRYYPDDMAAAAWLRTAPFGIISEATKPDASYTEFSRISTYSGLPTVLGWPMHEGQWRGTYAPQGSRQEDIRLLYETRSWEDAHAILEKYDIRYVCVGTLERVTYRINENIFQRNLAQVFKQGQVVIYEVP